MDMPILFEDKDVVVINKPAGLVTHPSAGRSEPSVALWAHLRYPEILGHLWPEETRGREGIVHRLDQDTSGVLVLARNPAAYGRLKEAFQTRTVKKTYRALVLGYPNPPSGTIDLAITRQRSDRRFRRTTGLALPWEGKVRPARTHYKTLHRYTYQNVPLSELKLGLETGRTHQIRVHLKALGHPVLGDPVYNIKLSREVSRRLGVERQLLHASTVAFTLPMTLKHISVTAPLPADFTRIQTQLTAASG